MNSYSSSKLVTAARSHLVSIVVLTLIATVAACKKDAGSSNTDTHTDAGMPGGDNQTPPPETGPDAPPGQDPSGAPVGLMATAVAPDEIDVCWRPVVSKGATYRIYRNDTALTTTAEVCFEDKSVAPATTYTYAVTAMNDGRESPKSSSSAATTMPAAGGDGTTMGDLRNEVTMQSIGIEWDVSGDSNHNATASVLFRENGSQVWRKALDLIRVDLNGANTLAGSILFLQPGTQYDVVVSMTDPDGGAATERFQTTTRAMPAPSTTGRTFHVAPGSGGGDGTESSPFKSIAAAAEVAKPGDVMLLHKGNYGGRISFATAGQPGNLITWKAAGDGDPVFAGIEVRGSYQWFEGLRVEKGDGANGLKTANSPTEVALVHCTFVGNHYSVFLSGGGSNWYIADNDITGDNTVTSESFSGEGIEMEHTAGHTVAHNRITLTGDGMSYCSRNCDIYGNDIFDTSDDGIEPDGGFANIRIWGNRMRNTGHNGISMQPMSGAPWYFIRNLIIGNSENMLKSQGSDRFVAVHNTFVNWSNLQPIWGYEMLNGTMRNNVWVSVNGGSIFSMGSDGPTWKTNLDYDGFDWGSSSSPLKVLGSTFKDLLSFSKASDQESHGVQLTRSCFPTLNVPAGPPASVPEQVLTLSADCAAIDAGEVLPNINDGFLGKAPDLGAFEYGAPALQFGPR